MTFLTPDEKKILRFIGGICIFGLMIQLSIFFFPTSRIFLFSSIEDLRNIKKIDINQATYVDLVKLSGINAQDAERILMFRRTQGRIRSLQELIDHKIVSQNSAKKSFSFLKVRP